MKIQLHRGAAAPSFPVRWCHVALLVALLVALNACAGAAPDAEQQSPAPRAREADALAQLADSARVVRINDELTIRRVARDAYLIMHTAGTAPANILAVRMPDGALVLCSSPYETGATRAMVRWLRDAFKPARMVAINTHFHPDGTGGNEAYTQEGVETYASNLTQELLQTRGAHARDVTARAFGEPLATAMERTPMIPAKHIFNAQEGLTLAFGNESMRVFYPGAAHSPDNVVVFFPSQQLLFGGCMIRAASAKIGYTGDADLNHWEAAVRALLPFAPRVVIPGHGEIGGIELLQHTIDVAREAQAAP